MNHRKYGLDICRACKNLCPVVAMRFTVYGGLCVDCFKKFEKNFFKA